MTVAAFQAMLPPKPSAAAETRLRVLVADDESLSRERLKRFLLSVPDTELVAECASGTQTVKAILEKAPDVVFLDVNMPELDGFGVLQALQGVRSPAIIFVTAYDRFALRAFEIDAVDYLLKPFDHHRFSAALRRARLRLKTEPSSTHPVASNHSSSAKPLERLTVRSSGRLTIIKTSEIDWISAADNYVELHVGSKVHLSRVTLGRLAERLDHRFVRISRSVVVNQDRIKEIRSKSHGDYDVLLSTGTSLAGSRNYRRGLAGLLKSFTAK